MSVRWKPPTAGLLLLFAPLLAAQWTPAPQPPYQDSQQAAYPANSAPTDEPDPADLQHGVARLSIVQGDVDVRRGDNGQVTGAVINAPVLTHDHLETGAGSRAEIQLGAFTMVRLGPNSELNFADLQYGKSQLQLGMGTIIFRVIKPESMQVEIDTPSVGIRALASGDYRISVFDNGTSEVTVRSGQLEISGPRGSERLDAGRTVLIRGDASDPEMQTAGEVERDQFDQWSEDRDRDFSAPQSYQYVDSDVQGAADLDRYGAWVPSGYGQVWRPQGVAADWSPYSNGQWSYVDYYGWSWIDYSPWGWAPYHYGRWLWNTGYGWCWWPGARYQRSYWSPALVGFFGFGGRVGIGFGGLGWVALGPHEPFHRWWGRGAYNSFNGYRGGFGINSYRNAAIRGGAMTATFSSFGGPRQHFAAATRSQLVGGSVFSGRLPVTATRESYSYSSRQPSQGSRFASSPPRSFYHQGATPPMSRTPSYSRGNSVNQGWQHFGSPTNSSTPFRQNFQSPEASGWHRFGAPQAGTGGAARQVRPESTYPQRQPGYGFGYGTQQRPSPRSFGGGGEYRPQQARPNYTPAAPRQNYATPTQRSAPRYNNPSPAPRGSGGGGAPRGGGAAPHGGGGARRGR